MSTKDLYGRDHDAEPDDSAGLIGTVIDKRYRITGVLGRGGMGTVYRAEHVTIRREVALKLLHPTFSKIREIGRRFEREAFAAGRVDHPNCVTASDFGELEDGTLFLVMELLEGESLADLVERLGRVEPRRALHIARHVLRGLACAHDAGVVHRDIKPDNIILAEREGDPDFARILDFGIAKLVGEAEAEAGGGKLTQAGVAFGTPLYLSPEQALGKEVDPRADLYSLSAVLFEMLTGKPPFDAEDKLQVLAMHATAEVPRLTDRAPDLVVQPAIEEIVRRGLGKTPADRFASAEAYIGAIDQVLARETAPPPAAAGAVLPRAAAQPTPMPVPGRAAQQTPLPVPGRAAQQTPLPVPGRAAQQTPLPVPGRAAQQTPLPVPGRAAQHTPLPVTGRAAQHTPMSVTGRAAQHTPLPAVGTGMLTPVPGTVSTRVRMRVAITRGWRTMSRRGRIGVIATTIVVLLLIVSAIVGRDYENGRSAAGRERDRLLQKYTRELEKGKRCWQRKRAVPKLRALGDKRAIPALQRAIRRTNKGIAGTGIGAENINTCLRDEAREAIQHLQEL